MVPANIEVQELMRPVKKMLLLVFLTTGVLVMGAVIRNIDKPLTNVVVSGKFSYLDQQVLISLLTDEIQGGFLSLDLSEIKLTIEAHPWIRQVNLTRQWPSTLLADVSEEVPIARWGKEAFLNYQGKKLEMEYAGSLRSLPELESPFVSSEKMMRQYQALTLQLAPTGLTIERLICDSDGLWSISTSEGFDLIIGRNQILQRMRRFALAWDFGLGTRRQVIRRVDLRYPNGLAVSWKSESFDESETITVSGIHSVSFGQWPV